jgi:hypothetical protein
MKMVWCECSVLLVDFIQVQTSRSKEGRGEATTVVKGTDAGVGGGQRRRPGVCVGTSVWALTSQPRNIQ